MKILKKKKLPCNRCGKKSGLIKFYIIADDLESPQPYHPKCVEELRMEIMLSQAV